MLIFIVFTLFSVFAGFGLVLQIEKFVRRNIKIRNIKIRNIKIRNIKIRNIKIDNIHSNRWLGASDKQDLTLLKSIEEIGLIQNIIVRPKDSGNTSRKKYILVHGERRIEGSKIAGKSKIPCIVLCNLTGRKAIISAALMCFGENLGKKKYSNYQTMVKANELVQLLIAEWSIGKTELEIKRIRRKSIREVANLGFDGDLSTVYKILQTKNLPNELQVLLKEKSERTEIEKKTLEKHNIKPDFKMDFKSLAVIEKIIQNLGVRPPKKKIQKIFEIINEFGLDKKKYNRRYELLRKFRDNLKTHTFEIVMQEIKEEMDHINIHFTITDEEYAHWHRLASEQKQLEPAQIAQRAYFKWLYRKAMKMGWINGHGR